jgi:hypothetical protein
MDGALQDIFIGDSLTYFMMSQRLGYIGYIRADSSHGQTPPTYSEIVKNVYYNDKLYNTVDDEDTKYYVNNEIKIDTLDFEKLEVYHWNKFFSATNGGIRLVGINRTKKIITVSEAIEINRIELSEKDFIPPVDYEIKKFDIFEIKE